MNVDILGYAAAILGSFSLLPQAIKTIKTKNTAGISLTTYIIFFVNIILWFSYGVLKDQKPIIMANVLPFFLTCVILYFKLKNMYKNKKPKRKNAKR